MFPESGETLFAGASDGETEAATGAEGVTAPICCGGALPEDEGEPNALVWATLSAAFVDNVAGFEAPLGIVSSAAF